VRDQTTDDKDLITRKAREKIGMLVKLLSVELVALSQADHHFSEEPKISLGSSLARCKQIAMDDGNRVVFVGNTQRIDAPLTHLFEQDVRGNLHPSIDESPNGPLQCRRGNAEYRPPQSSQYHHQQADETEGRDKQDDAQESVQHQPREDGDGLNQSPAMAWRGRVGGGHSILISENN